MKTAHTILLAAICLTLGYSNGAAAQDSAAVQEVRFVEKVIRDRTYVYTYYGTRVISIHNSRNYIDTIVEPYCDGYHAEDIEPIGNVFSSVFSDKRKREMKGMPIFMSLRVNSLGNVVEVRFISSDLSIITLEEVYTLETALLKYKFKMTGTCPDKRYYLFVASNKGWLMGK